MSGWIILSRSIRGHWIWKDPERLKWWIDLIFMANFEPSTEKVAGQKVFCERGQFATTQSGLAKVWNADYQVVYRFLRKMEQDGMIVVESNRHWTRITICNYDLYQLSERLNENPIIGISGSYGNGRKTERKTETQNERPCDNPTKDQSKNQTIENQGVIGGQRKTERKTDERPCETFIKEIKEINNNNNYNIGAQEQIFIDELKGSQSWLELMAMRYHLKGVDDVRKWIDEFSIEQQCRGVEHTDVNDFRKHFNDWLRIVLSNEKKGNGYAENRQRTDDKRRGTEISATSGQDYEGQF